jgi:hypothetical protein
LIVSEPFSRVGSAARLKSTFLGSKFPAVPPPKQWIFDIVTDKQKAKQATG